MAFGTVPPIAEMMDSLMDGSSATITKSCFGHRVLRLRTIVSSSEALTMLDSLSPRKSPSNDMWASPANSSIIARNRLRLSWTTQNLLSFCTWGSYHRHSVRFSCGGLTGYSPLPTHYSPSPTNISFAPRRDGGRLHNWKPGGKK